MLKIQTIKEGIPLALKQIEVSQTEFKEFCKHFSILIGKDYKNSNEDKAKKYINDFFTSLNYSTEVNVGCDVGGGIDLAVLESDSINIIIETKAYGSNEMISENNINTKALHEAVRYYLYQRVVENNLETKRIIITDYENWYIFDASEFYRLFVKNISFKTKYVKWRNKQLDGKDVNVFYNVVKDFFNENDTYIKCIKFSILDFNFLNQNLSELSENQVQFVKDLYRVFSQQFLLKKFKESDNNQLNNDFYKELLYIIGLEQKEKNGKQVIVRSSENESSSLIGNTISSFKDEIKNFSYRYDYGSSEKEIEFNIALELCLTWVNRILFLKLLEAQLLSYHNGDNEFKFLDFTKDWTYQEIDKLFFKVLAKRLEDRDDSVREKYRLVPYLNSSLFTATQLETEVGSIKNIDYGKLVFVFNKTKLRSENGEILKGKVDTLKYLFRFLSAYDFKTEQYSAKDSNLISASVLGLIFEKINGYEDGAVFTPSQITMLMCRNTLRTLVIRKINELYEWECDTFESLKDSLFFYIKKNIAEKSKIRADINQLINSLKICDVAVGSGHFLVSALNELITIKSELQVLCYKGDYSLLIPYNLSANNDELIIENVDGIAFKYSYGDNISQKVQETIFYEKQTIIENCLYGVDINAKSVQICQLRLWIELLKHAFYTKSSKYSQLETLPNIDINIKKGNSLLYRFELEKDLDSLETDQDEFKTSIAEYRKAVAEYKESKGYKENIKLRIEEFKKNLRTTFSFHDTSNKKLKLTKEYINACLLQTSTLFDNDPSSFLLTKVLKQLKDTNAKPKKGQVLLNAADLLKVNLTRDRLNEKNVVEGLKKLEKLLESEVKDKENSVLYKNAFEWRIEFPEILDDKGNFKGFDSIIANPPYMKIQTIAKNYPKLKLLYEEKYSVAKGNYEFANLFIELAHNLSAHNGENAFIFPHKFLNSDNGDELRRYLLAKKSIHTMLHFGANRVFKDADTFTCVIQFNNSLSDNINFYRTPYRADWASEMINESNFQSIAYKDIESASILYKTSQWHLLDNENEYELLDKIYTNSIAIKDICSDVFQGLATSKDDLYIVDLITENENTYLIKVALDEKVIEVEKELFKPFMRGIDTQRYTKPIPKKLIFFPYSPTGITDKRTNKELLISEEDLKLHPLTYVNYIKVYESEFKKRESSKAETMDGWWGYIYPKSINKFQQQKLSSMEISTIYPNVLLDINNLYHSTTVYSWILKSNAHISYTTLLAIANSKLFWWFLKRTGDTLKDDARRFKTNYLNPFPVPAIIESDIVLQLAIKVNERQQEIAERDQILLDKEIDGLIYKIYDLSLEQIQIIEEGVVWGWQKAG